MRRNPSPRFRAESFSCHDESKTPSWLLFSRCTLAHPSRSRFDRIMTPTSQTPTSHERTFSRGHAPGWPVFAASEDTSPAFLPPASATCGCCRFAAALTASDDDCERADHSLRVAKVE